MPLVWTEIWHPDKLDGNELLEVFYILWRPDGSCGVRTNLSRISLFALMLPDEYVASEQDFFSAHLLSSVRLSSLLECMFVGLLNLVLLWIQAYKLVFRS